MTIRAAPRSASAGTGFKFWWTVEFVEAETGMLTTSSAGAEDLAGIPELLPGEMLVLRVEGHPLYGFVEQGQLPPFFTGPLGEPTDVPVPARLRAEVARRARVRAEGQRKLRTPPARREATDAGRG